MLLNAKKILVINLRYIGDTIWMYPFLRNLKKNLPDAEISALINEGCEVFLRLMPELSEVMVFERAEIKKRFGIYRFLKFLKKIHDKHFDTVFILTNSDRPTIIGFLSGARTRIGFESDSWWRKYLLTERFTWYQEKSPHMVEYHLQALTDTGLKVFDRQLRLDIPEKVKESIQEKFPLLKNRERKSVIVHPGARTEMRQWGTDKFAAVINALSDTYRIFLIGGPAEQKIIQEVSALLNKAPDIVTTELSLLDFAALCTFGDLFIGNDSAPIHIAAAAGLLVIGIYGPTLSKHCSPWTEKKFLFDLSTLPCRMCMQDVCINEEKKACLEMITPGMVIQKIRELLAGQDPSLC